MYAGIDATQREKEGGGDERHSLGGSHVRLSPRHRAFSVHTQRMRRDVELSKQRIAWASASADERDSLPPWVQLMDGGILTSALPSGRRKAQEYAA